MAINYHYDIIQYTPEWDAIRCGVLTASKICKILTPAKLEIADNGTSRELVDTIACERITKLTDPTFQSYDMQRGLHEEILARKVYAENYAPVQQCGFVTNDKWGFKIGGSPDGLIGDDGGWECKSKLNKLQFGIIRSGKMPDEFRLQVQCLMMITERTWWDFTSYSGGMNMITIKVEADPLVHAAIEAAATDFEAKVKIAVEEYGNRLADKEMRIIAVPPTPQGDEIITTEEQSV